jgi:hypothetical protein
MGWAEFMVEQLSPLPDVFTTVWISDHLQFHGEPYLEGWTRLAYLAGLLPRYQFGNLVLSQSYRNPGLIGAMVGFDLSSAIRAVTRGLRRDRPVIRRDQAGGLADDLDAR